MTPAVLAISIDTGAAVNYNRCSGKLDFVVGITEELKSNEEQFAMCTSQMPFMSESIKRELKAVSR